MPLLFKSTNGQSPAVNLREAFLQGQAFEYEAHAKKLEQVRTSAQQHEFLCFVAGKKLCTERYDAFSPILYAGERNISKRFRDCASGCKVHAPELLNLETHTISSVEEIRKYEAASRCFSQCVDVVFPDFKHLEQEIEANHKATKLAFPID